MSFEQAVNEIIVQTLQVNPEEVKPDGKLYDSLGVDSTEIVDLRVALEKKFEIKIGAQEITKFNSPQEIANLITSKNPKS